MTISYNVNNKDRKNEAIKQALEDQQKKAIEQAKAAANSKVAPLSQVYINHRISCPTCRKAETSKGLCAGGKEIWLSMMGRKPSVMIR